MPPGLMGFSQGDDQPGRFFFVPFLPDGGDGREPAEDSISSIQIDLLQRTHEIDSVW